MRAHTLPPVSYLLPPVLYLLPPLLIATACARVEPQRTPRSIVLITIDTLRADHVNERLTPALAGLAREGVVFETAITVTPLTLPSHASLLTANFPPAHGVRDNTIYSLPAATPTYASRLRERGYATAAFVSAVVLDSRYGLDAGFDVYDDEIGGRPERPASETLAAAWRWMESRSDGRPFFVWVHLFEPHAPYLAGSYAAEITAVDREVGRFFDRLRGRKLWDDVIVSVTSDHGESLGEHGEQTHGFFVYDSTLRIPWILKAPDQRALRYQRQVRIVDAMPTIAAMADGLTTPADADGVNLQPFFGRGDPPSLEAYADTYLPRDQFQWSELRALRTERLKYIAAPRPELFDLTVDPAERRNLIADRPQDAERLRRVLDALERKRSAVAARTTADPVMEEKFMALGYIGYSPDAGAPGAVLPDPKDKLEVYALAMSALELSEHDRPAEALEALARAERLDPAVAQVHYLKGSILGAQNRYREAAAALERVAALNPRFVAARFKLALAYVRLQQPERASRLLEGVLKDEPRNVRALHNLAAIAFTRGDLEAAGHLERQAVAIDPAYAEAWNTLGAIHVMRKRFPDAVAALNTTIRLDPSNGQAHYNLALALRGAGQAEAARAAAARACELDRRYCP